MKEELDLEEVAPWLVFFITLSGAFLRVFLLDRKGMWLDETFSVWLANQRVGEMLPWVAAIDQHPPLYYLLLHFWVALKGDTPYYVRLLSVLFNAGTIPVIYLIGKRLSGVMVGLAAAVLLALSPFHIRFAQEARMYALLTFNAAVAIYALVCLLTDSRAASPIGSQFREYLHVWRTAEPAVPGTNGSFSYKVVARPQTGWRGWIYRHHWLPLHAIGTDLAWVGFIVFSAATMLSHNTAVLFPVATNIFIIGLMLWQKRQKSGSSSAFQAPPVGNWVKSQVGIFLLWSPWLLAFIRQARRVYEEFWIPTPTWDSVTQVLKAFLNENTLAQSGPVRAIWLLYILVLGLGVLHYRKNFSRFLLLAVLFVTPFVGELLVSIRRPIFYDRTLIWISIPLLLVLAAGIVQLRFRSLIILGLGVLGTINLFSTGDYYRFLPKEDWSTAAGYVANFAEKDDLVLFNTTWAQIPFDYYFIAYEELYAIEVEKHGVPEDMFTSGVLEPIMSESDVPGLISLVSGHDRVWLVYSHNSYSDPMGLIPQTLGAEKVLRQQRNFYGGMVQLYESP
ncbi:MAG: glycosyltransferase family 39 protein [Ardenticatenaceae bacterium]|nr:glycosyltransferase family 39 protein [Ardenticatenaceae bacterium]